MMMSVEGEVVCRKAASTAKPEAGGGPVISMCDGRKRPEIISLL